MLYIKKTYYTHTPNNHWGKINCFIKNTKTVNAMFKINICFKFRQYGYFRM